MKFNNLRIVALSFIVLTLFVTQPAVADIKLGMLVPLTGPLARFGQDQLTAVRLATGEINDAGGINRNRIQLIIHDTEGNPMRASAAANRLIHREQVSAILGPSLSGEAMAVSSLANENRIPLITSSASDPRVTLSKPWVFRTNLTSEKLLMAGISKWTTHQKIRSAAIVFDKGNEQAYTQSTTQIPEILRGKGVRLAGLTSFFGREIYFSKQVKEILWKKPDGVIIHAFTYDTANIVRQLVEMGYNGTTYAINVPIGQLDAKHFSRNPTLYFVTSFWPTSDNPRQMRFVRNYKKRVAGDFISPAAAQIYDAIYVIKTILERSRSNVGNPERNQRAIKDGFTGLRNYQGVSGAFSIDRNGDAEREVNLITVRSGKYELVH